MTLLTIVTPIRDMGGKLGPLFSWVKDALDRECEVILIHDYQDEQTEIEISNFYSQNKNRKLIFLSAVYNSPGLARNAGLAVASGEFISFWDSDDLPNVTKYIEMATYCSLNKYEIGIGGFRTQSEDGKSLTEYPTSEQNTLNRIAIYPGLWRIIFKKTVIGNIKFSELLLAEDQLFFASINPEDKNLYFFHEIVYTYTVARSGGLTDSRKNLVDLPKAARKIQLLTDSIYSDYNPLFKRTLLIRIAITMLKRGSRDQKLLSSTILGKLLLKHLPSSLQILNQIAKFKLSENKL